MKKLLLLGFVAFIAFGMQAQIFVGGNFSFNTQSGADKSGTVSVDKPVYVNFNIGPKVGYYITDDLAAGIQFEFGGNGRSSGSGNTEVINATGYFGISPFAQYHFMRSDKFSLMGQAVLGLNFKNTTTTTAGNAVEGPKTTTIAFGVRPGASYELTESIALEAFIGNLGFSHESEKDDSGTQEQISTTNKFGFSLTDNISLGFIVKF